jgi:hypothetical protein
MKTLVVCTLAAFCTTSALAMPSDTPRLDPRSAHYDGPGAHCKTVRVHHHFVRRCRD